MKELALVTTPALALAAATATTVFEADLSQYERVDIGLENTGANPVTAATWEQGVANGSSSVLDDDATHAGVVQAALVAGGKSLTTLTGDDVPSRLKVRLTSNLGTDVKVVVRGRLKAASLLPVG
jgi:hypothetical protein